MSDPVAIRRGDVVIAMVAEPGGKAIRKRRPHLVISPDVLNEIQHTYLIVPLTTGNHPYRFRIPCQFAGRAGHVVLDQIFTLDAASSSPVVGKLSPLNMKQVLSSLREMFAE